MEGQVGMMHEADDELHTEQVYIDMCVPRTEPLITRGRRPNLPIDLFSLPEIEPRIPLLHWAFSGSGLPSSVRSLTEIKSEIGG